MAGTKNEHDEFHSDKHTLQELLDSEKFPLVVRTCHDYVKSTDDSNFRIANGTLIYIQEIKKVQYVHIKVLDVHDEQKAAEDRYDEFVYERGNFVGKEYLLPMRYPGKLKFVHRPKKRTRYASMTHVLEDMPHILRVEEEVESAQPGGKGRTTVLPVHSLLRVKRSFVSPLDNTNYLECSCDHKCYTFSEQALVNFTAVLDPQSYSLTDMVRNKYFPAVFEFQNAQGEKICHFDDELASSTLVIAQGPLELLGTAHKYVVVAWVRQKSLKTYKTLLLPKGMLDAIIVQQRRFEDDLVNGSFIRKKFAQCPDSDFIERGLYALKPNQEEALWLKSPKLYRFNLRGTSIKTALEIDFQDSTDDEQVSDHDSDPYEDVRPPVPSRVPIVAIGKSLKETMKVKKNLFGKVHVELKNWFTKKVVGTVRVAPARPPKPRIHIVQRSVSEVSTLVKRPQRQQSRPSFGTSGQTDFRRSVSTDTYSIGECNITDNVIDSDDHYDKVEKTRYPYDYTYVSRCQSQTEHGGQRSSSTAGPDGVNSDNNEDTGESTYLAPGQTDRTEHVPEKYETLKVPYSTIDFKDMQGIIKEKVTSEDFFRMSVLQVSHLFRYCSLKKIADACFEHLLDGAFFRDYDLDKLQNEPFDANKFEVMKVKQIIYKEWRPKME